MFLIMLEEMKWKKKNFLGNLDGDGVCQFKPENVEGLSDTWVEVEDIKNIDDLRIIINKNGLSFMYGTECGLNSEDEILIGKTFDIDECDECIEIDYNKMVKEIKIISDLFNISKEDIKIFFDYKDELINGNKIKV